MADLTYLGEDIPKLGFGLMRLPTLEGGAIDLEQTKQMTDLFLERGFRYFDTAYGYSNGESEKAIKKALVERYPRESFYLATKLPAWAGANNAEEAKQMFYTSLERTGAGYFDFYLLHNIGASRTAKFEEYGIWDYVKDLKAKGLVKHWGFSFHDSAELLDEVLTQHPDAEFVQLQINYADWESGGVQSRACHEVAWGKHRKPVVIMEPIKGGMLANPAPPVKKVFDAADTGASAASWAIRFAASLPGIITVLSGMSNLEQMRDNTGYMQHFKPLDDAERAVISDVQAALAALPSVPCTACKYCVPECPRGIGIPGIFDAMNRELVYGDAAAAKFGYNLETTVFGGAKASECVACASCESVCPQKINIIERLKEAAAKYE
ncbi:MAG: aldo/keto reductase [Oscillospiraceae bacterium]|jgi:predicted aldo/keto reductase-like oxidoreductase|nr:aldo/keto reductase [Oscillospiraceae bacterium]